MSAASRLKKELSDLVKDSGDSGVGATPINDNILHLTGSLKGPDGTPYDGGTFLVDIVIPQQYPFEPPKMKFTTPVWHPNIHEDGKVCISILHAPGEDATGYEKSEERWSPVQSIEKVLISVLSMLAEPNDESPANVDAAKMWRDDRAMFHKKCLDNVKISLGFA